MEVVSNHNVFTFFLKKQQIRSMGGFPAVEPGHRKVLLFSSGHILRVAPHHLCSAQRLFVLRAEMRDLSFSLRMYMVHGAVMETSFLSHTW